MWPFSVVRVSKKFLSTANSPPSRQILKITPKALERLRELSKGPNPKLIKIGIRNRGCSGMSYNLEYTDIKGKFDEEVAQDGVKVIIDSKALLAVIGSEMDFVEDELSSQFVFNNPNITEQCGCGLSFSTS